MKHSRYSIALQPNGLIEVLERSDDIEDAWIVIATFATIAKARAFAAAMQGIETRLIFAKTKKEKQC